MPKPDYSRRKHISPQHVPLGTDVEFAVSDLKYLLQCHYRFKLRSLFGFTSPIEPGTGYGGSMHNALAEVHHRAMEGEPIDTADVSGLVRRHLLIRYASGNRRKNFESAARRDISNYITDNMARLKSVVFAEKDVEIPIDNEITVKGRIDVVQQADNGETTIVDLKSTERSHDEEVTEAQLHAYALGYKKLTGQDVDYVEIYELRERRRKRRAVDTALISSIKQKIRAAAQAVREMKFEPQPSKKRCRDCNVRALCSASMA